MDAEDHPRTAGPAPELGTALDEVVAGVGARIKGLRTQRGMTLQELAEATGLSASMLSTVERGRTTPSLGTLHRLCEALGVRMASLFVPAADGASPVRRREEQIVDTTAGGAVRRLAVFHPDQDVELYVDEYPPQATHAIRPSQHPGHEYGVVLEGDLEVELGDEVHAVGEGDAIQYAAKQAHLVRNTGTTTARAVWVNLRRL